MSDDIYFFVRDRYFVGETVEACVNGDSWAEAHVLSVVASKNSSPSMLGLVVVDFVVTVRFLRMY